MDWVLHVARLFRISAFRCIIQMLNSFVLLTTISFMYSLMGPALRPEIVLNFHTSLFTMKQVLAGDSGASSLARGRMFYIGEETNVKSTDPSILSLALALSIHNKQQYRLFFVSYYRSVINVVMLLEEFQAAVEREKEAADRIVESDNAKRRIMLNPLSSQLTLFRDRENLTK